MERKVNYNEVMQGILRGLPSGQDKPRLLLHVCCAPCSTAVLERLAAAFDITVYFDNPNLDTAIEHDKRAGEAEALLARSGWASRVIIAPYDPRAYYRAVKRLEDEPEGGLRCAACFSLRLARSARAAREAGCDWFTTTLSVSPRKDAALLNRLGRQAGEAAGVPFLPGDFKKQGGYPRSVQLSRQFGLYRQDYCGCVFSRRDRDKRQNRGLPPEPSP